MWIHNEQQRGERGQKGREKFLCLNFLCLAITYELCFTRCSALLVEGIHVSIYFLSPAFLLLNQHRKLEKGNIHLTIHHPSTFLHLYSLLSLATQVCLNKMRIVIKVFTPSVHVPVTLFYKHVPPVAPIYHLDVYVVFHCLRNS